MSGGEEAEVALLAEVRRALEDLVDLDGPEQAIRLEEIAAREPELARRLRASLDPSLPEIFLEPPEVVGDPSNATAGSGPFSTPETIGNYRVLGPVARGGMGRVLLAEQAHPRRRVALKLISEPFPSDVARQRFEREVRILGRFVHPGIARIYEAGTYPGWDGSEEPFLAMEYVEAGRPLTEHADEGGLDVRARLELFAQVCDAVHHGHDQGVVHRDLKPANILVDSAGQPKVIDFGIARQDGLDASLSGLTGDSDVFGTLAYMAPEQLIAGASRADERADVYSLGVVLYELLCGAQPFDFQDKSLIEAAILVSTHRPPSPSRVRPGIPRELDRLTEGAMAQDRELRYPSAAELAADVRRWLAHRPLHVVPPSVLYRARKLVQRHPAPTSAAGLLVAASVALVLYLEVIEPAVLAAELQSDIDELGVLEESWQEIPGLPDRRRDLEDWLARAAALEARLDGYREELAELEERSEPVDAELLPTTRRGKLSELVTGLERLEAVPVRLLEERLASSRDLRERSVAGAEAERRWTEALASIADPEACPLYEGLELAPQEGLLPIRRNPATGLWEFAHLLSGRPAGVVDGELETDEGIGLVLILLPAPVFTMGAHPDDARAEKWERPCAPVVLTRPYFLSKFEMTRAQWERATGIDPSDNRDYDDEPSPRLPVQNMTWEEAVVALRGLDLVLPTEARWEFAARGGVEHAWPYWWGPTAPEIWSEVGRFGGPGAPAVEVGGFPANPYGFHDVLSNIGEWCLDRFGEYDQHPELDPATGERTVDQTDDPWHVFRHAGVHSLRDMGYERITMRWGKPVGEHDGNLGLRPARGLDPR